MSEITSNSFENQINQQLTHSNIRVVLTSKSDKESWSFGVLDAIAAGFLLARSARPVGLTGFFPQSAVGYVWSFFFFRNKL
jgi:hypothetical protein